MKKLEFKYTCDGCGQEFGEKEKDKVVSADVYVDSSYTGIETVDEFEHIDLCTSCCSAGFRRFFEIVTKNITAEERRELIKLLKGKTVKHNLKFTLVKKGDD